MSSVKHICYIIFLILTSVILLATYVNKPFELDRKHLIIVYFVFIIITFSNLIVEKKLFTWDKIIGWSFFIYSASVPLYIISEGKMQENLKINIFFNEVYDINLVLNATLINCIFISFFYTGFFLFKRTKLNFNLEQQTKIFDTTFINNRSYYFSVFGIYYWILFNIGLYLLGFWKINYFSAILNGYSLGNVGYIYIFTAVYGLNIGVLILLAVFNFQKKYLIFLSVFHLFLFPLGIRQLTLTFMLQLLFLYLFMRKKNINKIFNKKIALISTFLLSLFSVIGSFRAEKTYSLDISNLVLGPIKYYLYETTFTYLSFLKTLKLFDQHHVEYLYGKAIIDPVVDLIPRAIFPNKNEYQFFESFIKNYSTLEDLKPVGTSHLLTEVFVNGGIWAVIIFSFVLGISGKVMNQLMVWCYRNKNVFGVIFFSAIIPYFLIQLNRGGISLLLKLIIQFSWIPIFIFLILRTNPIVKK